MSLLRRLLASVACLVPFLAIAGAQGQAQPPGSGDWQLTRVRVDASGFRSKWVEGYCSKQSVAAGETIDIMVSTDPAQKYQIELFRMGYYDGLGARLVKKLGPLEGKPRPMPEPGEKTCRAVVNYLSA